MALFVVLISVVALGWCGGWPWIRHFSYALLFPLVAVPWPSKLEQPLVQNLMRSVAIICSEVLTATGSPAIAHGNIVETAQGPVGIEDACSGIQSFQASIMMSLFLGEVLALRRGPRFLLFGGAIAWAFFCNVGRTLYLSMLGASKGIQAVGEAHDVAGYGVMAISYAGIIAGALWLARGIRPPDPMSLKGASNPIPSAWLFAGAAVLGLAEIATDQWYLKSASASHVETVWRVKLPGNLKGAESIEYTGAERTALRFNSGEQYSWMSPEGHRWKLNFSRWEPGNLAVDNARNHNPLICLPAAGLKLEHERPTRPFQIGGRSIPFQVATLSWKEKPLHTFFCFWSDAGGAGLPKEPWNTDTWSSKTRLQNVWARRRTGGLQLLSANVVGAADFEAAAKEFQSLLDQIAVP